MRFLADENLPGPVVHRLREEGLDVRWVREDLPGGKDSEVLKAAGEEGRVLLTFDKDFGELAFRSGLHLVCGVLLFRFSIRSMDFVASKILNVIRSREDWQGMFAVVEETRIRVVALPNSPRN